MFLVLTFLSLRAKSLDALSILIEFSLFPEQRIFHFISIQGVQLEFEAGNFPNVFHCGVLEHFSLGYF